MNAHRTIFWTVAALLTAASALAQSQPASRKTALPHYITIKFGGPHPHAARMTVQQWKENSLQAETTTRREIAAANQRRRLQRFQEPPKP